MINKNKRWRQWTKLPLAAAVAATISAPAQAFQFYLGDIEGSLDTTLTAGASWRISDRDKNQLSPGNQGLSASPTGSYSNAASSHNSDNGNWNFKQGETYSKIIKGTSDLMLRYGDYGGFTRLRYFYDRELMDEGRAYDEAGQTRPINKQGLEQAGADVRFLDAYVWGDWYLGDTPVNARLGRQVVSWGESTFILGGVNIINPIDAAAARAPGAEVKDVLLPVNMFYMSVGITEDLTTELFYQIEWEKAEADPCGTFFSNSDSGPDGCGGIVTTAQSPESVIVDLEERSGIDTVNERLADNEPDNNGQFGIAARWYAADLGDTEFGFYFVNYHSRLPYASFLVQDATTGQGAKYFIEFPEDIQLFGISFNTSTDSGWSIGGEITHRPNLPIQKNTFELTAASRQAPFSAFADEAVAGQVLRGYDEFAVTQAQVTFIKFIDQVLGASRLTFVSEIGAVFVHDLPNDSRYGRDSTYGIGPVKNGSGFSCETPAVNLNPSFCEDKGYVTDFSAGYRMRFTLDYPNVFAGINLEPSLAWSHDVKGYAPEPGAPFKEGSKAVGLTLKGVYLNKYSASIGYTNFFGGEPYNYLNDRDNVSASVSVSF